MRIGFASICLIVLAACGREPSGEAKVQAGSLHSPPRIVSLDYCADQYVLALADEDNIVALSPDAEKKFSYFRDKAAGIAKVRPSAENVLALKPDLVVRSYGGGPDATRFYETAGVAVLQVGWSNSFADIRQVLFDMSAGLGVPDKGVKLAAEFDQRLAAINKRNLRQSALYMTPGGVTSGTGSLIDDMFSAAGLTNYQDKPGWHDLPLERLIAEKPDVVASAFYETIHKTPSIWSPSHHPIAQKTLDEAELVPLDSSWTSCGAWYLMDAIEALAIPAQGAIN